jgi:hypothetical protein
VLKRLKARLEEMKVIGQMDQEIKEGERQLAA